MEYPYLINNNTLWKHSIFSDDFLRDIKNVYGPDTDVNRYMYVPEYIGFMKKKHNYTTPTGVENFSESDTPFWVNSPSVLVKKPMELKPWDKSKSQTEKLNAFMRFGISTTLLAAIISFIFKMKEISSYAIKFLIAIILFTFLIHYGSHKMTTNKKPEKKENYYYRDSLTDTISEANMSRKKQDAMIKKKQLQRYNKRLIEDLFSDPLLHLPVFR